MSNIAHCQLTVLSQLWLWKGKNMNNAVVYTNMLSIRLHETGGNTVYKILHLEHLAVKHLLAIILRRKLKWYWKKDDIIKRKCEVIKFAWSYKVRLNKWIRISFIGSVDIWCLFRMKTSWTVKIFRSKRHYT